MAREFAHLISKDSRRVPCRSCQKAILFVPTGTGKYMPIDEDGTSHFATCDNPSRFRRKEPRR